MRTSYISSPLRPTVAGTAVIPRHECELSQECCSDGIKSNPDFWIISWTQDSTSRYLGAFAKARGFFCNQINLDQPQALRWLRWDSTQGLGIEISTGVFFRPPGFADPAFAVAVNLLGEMLSTLSVPIVNRYASQSPNFSKPLQTASFVSTRGSAVVSHVPTNICPAEHVVRFQPLGDFVVKSISGTRSQVVSLDDLRLQRDPSAASFPVQIQPRLRGVNVRTHVCGDTVVAAKLSFDEAVDYRYAHAVEIQPFRLPQNVTEWCVAAARRERLALAGIDLIMTDDGEWFCFEVNPMPGYDWFEEALTQQGEPPTISELLLHRLVCASKNL